MRRSIVGLCLVIGTTTAAHGQLPDSLVGREIRFRPDWHQTNPDFGWLDGRVVSIASDTARVRICSGCREPIRELTPIGDYDMQRHVGFGGSRPSNARWGAIAGAVAGLIGVSYQVSSCGPPNDMCSLGFLFTPVYVGGGAISGALIGALFPPGRWISVLRPEAGGVGRRPPS